jgi:hypothetical protein
LDSQPDRAEKPLEQVFRKFVRMTLIEHLFDNLRGPDRARRRDRYTATDTDRHRHGATERQTETGKP